MTDHIDPTAWDGHDPSYPVRAVGMAHQRALLEQMSVRQLAEESPAKVREMLHEIVDWLAEYRLSDSKEVA